MRNLLLFYSTIICFYITIFQLDAQEKQIDVSFNLEDFYEENLGPFYHGVASGDPLQDRVIIWTRVTTREDGPVCVRFEVDDDKNFTSPLVVDSIWTDRQVDYTVNVDVSGLSAGTPYYYRFEALGKKSIVGSTKTLPAETANFDLAVVSCSNIEWGYFNGYARLAETEVDIILHLGDYIYEHASGVYGNDSLPRKAIPDKELITIEDYRTRYAQYRLDEDLRHLHQAHPFILIWDDHEFANDAYKDGAQNHQDNEGSYSDRISAAKKAYYEWLPIRKSDHHYRSFQVGNLLDIIMLDGRMAGRTAQLSHPDDVDSTQSMLGPKQLLWFQKALKSSTASWKVVGNQVVFSNLDIRGLREPGANMDAWDGYAIERDQISNFISQEDIDNVIFVTGDTHASWAFEVPHTAGRAIELATPSISSGNWDETRPKEQVIMGEVLLKSKNEHLKYVNLRDHGFLQIHLSNDKAVAKWIYTDDLSHRNTNQRLGMEVMKTIGKSKLKITIATDTK